MSSVGTYALTVRVRVFALAPDGRCALDPIAQGSFPCEATPDDASSAASDLIMSSSEGIAPAPSRCRIEVALWRASNRGTPPALNVDAPWHERARVARELTQRLAVRVLRAPPPVPPMSPLRDAITDGALEGADAFKDLRDLGQLLRVAAASGEPGAAELAELADSPLVADLLKNPKALELAQALMSGDKE
jgi:hypothetical protein